MDSFLTLCANKYSQICLCLRKSFSPLLSEWGIMQGMFCSKVETQGWICARCSWSSYTLRKRKSLYFLMIICKSRLLFHGREQCSSAYKETCTETSRCEQSCFWHGKRCCFTRPLGPFQEDPKESHHLVEDGHPMSPLKHSHHTIRLTLKPFWG